MDDQKRLGLPQEKVQTTPPFYRAKALSYKKISARRQIQTRDKYKSLSIKNIAGEPLHTPLTEDNNTSAKSPLTVKSSDGRQLLMMLTDNRLNLLLFFGILAVMSKLLNWAHKWIFTFNFLAILPLAWLLGDLTEVVAGHLGDAFGGMIIAIFGNAVDLILVVIAMKESHVGLVQATVFGGILFNILFVLGHAMMVAGYKHKLNKITLNAAGASIPVLSLLISVFLIMITSIQAWLTTGEDNQLAWLKFISRVGAVIMIVMYILSFIYTFRPHSDYVAGEQWEARQEQMSLFIGLAGLCLVIVLVYIFSNFLIGSMNGVSEISGMSKTFLAVLLLPIRGNVVELWTAVICAWRGNLSLSILITLSSATQLSLFVLPMAVIVGWILDKDVTIVYHLSEVALLIFTIVMVSFIVQLGKANWLFGSMLVLIYCFIMLVLWHESE